MSRLTACLVATVVLMSCLPHVPNAYAADGFPLGRAFVLISLGGRPIDTAMRRLPSIEIRRDGKRLRASGHAGCNLWTGEAQFPSADMIAFGVVVTTRMACPDMAVEQTFLEALRQPHRWRTEGDRLILENDRDTLHFRLAPGDSNRR
jgi:heat shock protein HslJ